ncbi:MAG: hypothetical protein ACR2IA_13690, partial [Pyrinomonadaceae bacterium]
MNQQLLTCLVLLLVICLQLAPVSIAAQPSANPANRTTGNFDRSRYAIQYKKFVLDNGLTLLVHEAKSVPIVGVNMWYHVG